MAHPLSPAPLSPRYRDGALRPGQLYGGGLIPGLDAPGLRHAEGQRVAHQAARGDRQVLRPLIQGQSSSAYTVRAFLIDSANPDVERALEEDEPDGVVWGYFNGVQKDIVFLLTPALPAGQSFAGGSGNYSLMVDIDWETTNDGVQAALMETQIGLLEFDYRWSVSPVTWNNRPVAYDGAGSNLVLEQAGSDQANEDSIAPADSYGPVMTFTPAFTQDIGAGICATWTLLKNSTLPDGGFLLSAGHSNRTYKPPGWIFGDPLSEDRIMTVACMFYGYKFLTETQK